MNFLKNSHFTLFDSLANMPKILKFISGISHTDTCTYTDTGTHRQIPFLHFTNLIFGTPRTHKYTDTDTIFGSFGNEPMQS